jgi:hypothetical protein
MTVDCGPIPSCRVLPTPPSSLSFSRFSRFNLQSSRLNVSGTYYSPSSVKPMSVQASIIHPATLQPPAKNDGHLKLGPDLILSHLRLRTYAWAKQFPENHAFKGPNQDSFVVQIPSRLYQRQRLKFFLLSRRFVPFFTATPPRIKHRHPLFQRALTLPRYIKACRPLGESWSVGTGS